MSEFNGRATCYFFFYSSVCYLNLVAKRKKKMYIMHMRIQKELVIKSVATTIYLAKNNIEPSSINSFFEKSKNGKHKLTVICCGEADS